jgi:hypothetical protein
MIREEYTMTRKDSIKKGLLLFQGTVPLFSRMLRVKRRKTSARAVGFPINKF